MRQPELYLELLTPLPLTSREEGNRVLKLWEHFLPSYLPDKCGNTEPLKHPFELQNRISLLELWRWPFLAKRKKPRMEANIFMRERLTFRHATWSLTFRLQEVDVMEVSRFLLEAATKLQVDFGCLTLLTSNEIELGIKQGTVAALNRSATRFNFFIATHRLQRAIPDIYWLTVLGEPYVQMFGKERLLSVPAYKVEALGDQIVALQLSPRLEDMEDDPAMIQETRTRIKSHLGADAFFTPGKETGYRVPQFVWK